MFVYPIEELLDAEKCYKHIEELLHDGRLKCPECRTDNYRAHSYSKKRLVQYRCRSCNKFFNLYTNTIFEGRHLTVTQSVCLVRGFFQGTSTSQLSKELNLDRGNLLSIRHEFNKNAYENRIADQLEDLEIEIDEMYQNAGEKAETHLDPNDPPRKRANKKKGMALMKTTGLL